MRGNLSRILGVSDYTVNLFIDLLNALALFDALDVCEESFLEEFSGLLGEFFGIHFHVFDFCVVDFLSSVYDSASCVVEFSEKLVDEVSVMFRSFVQEERGA